jgi:lipopolysaccharide assembly outer membrane protein LptD (OstA)
MDIKKVASRVMIILVFLCVSSGSTLAQQKKGDKEITAFASGFSFSFGGGFRPRSLAGASGFFSENDKSLNFNLGAQMGYFITRKSEIGGGLFLSVSHFSGCTTALNNGQITGKTCDSDSFANLGLVGFYRYNFAKADARGFPFVGVSIGIGSVTDNYTGNIRARPHAGYKYFLKKNVALDFSVGYDIDVNKVSDSKSFFIQERGKVIDGQVGLSFVF